FVRLLEARVFNLQASQHFHCFRIYRETLSRFSLPRPEPTENASTTPAFTFAKASSPSGVFASSNAPNKP
ncbi:hypothetical protein ABLN72_17490, partial [Mycobacterium tuberculosis]